MTSSHFLAYPFSVFLPFFPQSSPPPLQLDWQMRFCPRGSHGPEPACGHRPAQDVRQCLETFGCHSQGGGGQICWADLGDTAKGQWAVPALWGSPRAGMQISALRPRNSPLPPGAHPGCQAPAQPPHSCFGFQVFLESGISPCVLHEVSGAGS